MGPRGGDVWGCREAWVSVGTWLIGASTASSPRPAVRNSGMPPAPDCTGSRPSQEGQQGRYLAGRPSCPEGGAPGCYAGLAGLGRWLGAGHNCPRASDPVAGALEGRSCWLPSVRTAASLRRAGSSGRGHCLAKAPWMGSGRGQCGQCCRPLGSWPQGADGIAPLLPTHSHGLGSWLPHLSGL